MKDELIETSKTHKDFMDSGCWMCKLEDGLQQIIAAVAEGDWEEEQAWREKIDMDNWFHNDNVCKVIICPQCKLPVVIYNLHTRPNGAELVHMEKCLVEYGSKFRRLGIVSKEMREAPDHFHLHLR